jgi:hypothetical protein
MDIYKIELYSVTLSFLPFGNSALSFLQPENEELIQYFSTVILIVLLLQERAELFCSVKQLTTFKSE